MGAAVDYLVQKISNIAAVTWDNRNATAVKSWLSLKQDARPCKCTTKSVACFFHGLGIGGGERVTRSWINLWLQMDYSVTILTNVPAIESEFVDPLPEGVKHIVLPNSEKMTSESYAQRCQALNDALTEEHIDTFVLCHWFFRTLPYDVMLAKCLGIKVFLFIQSSFSLFFLDSDATYSYVDTPLSYRLMDGVICLSETDRCFWSNFNQNTFVANNPATVEVPADLSELAPLNGRSVIWPARLHPDKKPERTLPILKELLSIVPDAELLMVGPVEEATKVALLQEAAQMGITDHLSIIGPQPESEMEQWYRKADAFLLTSEREGWSLALAEALSLGLPCVIYDLPYLTLATCKAVISIPQGDSQKAAQALAKVLLDKPYAHSLAIEGNRFMLGIASFDFAAFWQKIFTSNNDDQNEIQITNSNEPGAGEVMWSELFRAYRHNVQDRENALSLARNEAEAAHLANNQLQFRISELENELTRIRNSHSFKLGKAITTLPRMIRVALQR